MTTNKVVGFLITSIALLVTSIVITLLIVLPGGPTQPQSINAYVFNFNRSNSENIYSVTDTRLQLKNDIKFTPDRSIDWSDSLISFKGNSINDGIEYHTTTANKYVCAIPFIISNNYDTDYNVNIRLNMSGDSTLKNLISYKVYDYADKTFKTLQTINCTYEDTLYASGDRLNLIKHNTSRSFCLVAVAYDSANNFTFGTKYVSFNLEISLDSIL